MTKYNKGSHTRERVTQAVYVRSDKISRDTSATRQYSHILAVTSQEIVVVEHTIIDAAIETTQEIHAVGIIQLDLQRTWKRVRTVDTLR